MIAFALSGGGVRGAVQVGALLALVDHGIRPALVTGTSAGALNGVSLCLRPTREGLVQLEDVWIRTKREDIWPGWPLSWAWAALTGKLGLVSYTHLLGYVERTMETVYGRGDLLYRDCEIPLLVTTVDVVDRVPMVLGGDLLDPLAITVTASAALPFVSEPVPYHGTLLTDGGVANPMPIDVAVRGGATEIYALDLSGAEYPYTPTNIVEMAAALFDAQQAELAHRSVMDALQFNVTLHHIVFDFAVGLFDFSHAEEMIAVGYEETRRYLDNPTPLRVRR